MKATSRKQSSLSSITVPLLLIILISLMNISLSENLLRTTTVFTNLEITGVTSVPVPTFADTLDFSYEIAGLCTIDDIQLNDCVLVVFANELGSIVYNVPLELVPERLVNDGNMFLPYNLYQSVNLANMPNQIVFPLTYDGVTAGSTLTIDLYEDVANLESLVVLLEQISSYKRDSLSAIKNSIVKDWAQFKVAFELAKEYYNNMSRASYLNTKIKEVTQAIAGVEAELANERLTLEVLRVRVNELANIVKEKEKALRDCKVQQDETKKELDKSGESVKLSPEEFEDYKFRKEMNASCEFRLSLEDLKLVVPGEIINIKNCAEAVLKKREIARGREILKKMRGYVE